jgi:ribosome-associated translation inhibitor RaiA
MFLPLQITLRNVPHSEELDKVVRGLAERLQHCLPRVAAGHVVVERAAQLHAQFAARIELKMADGEIVAERRHHRDARVAVGDAFEALRLRLEDLKTHSHRQ